MLCEPSFMPLILLMQIILPEHTRKHSAHHVLLVLSCRLRDSRRCRLWSKSK